MSKIIAVVYEQVLPHPAVPLSLQEHESVCILKSTSEGRA